MENPRQIAAGKHIIVFFSFYLKKEIIKARKQERISKIVVGLMRIKVFSLINRHWGLFKVEERIEEVGSKSYTRLPTLISHNMLSNNNGFPIDQTHQTLSFFSFPTCPCCAYTLPGNRNVTFDFLVLFKNAAPINFTDRVNTIVTV